MLRYLILIATVITTVGGVYRAPQNEGTYKIILNGFGQSDTTIVTSKYQYDSYASMLVFGGCAQPISCVNYVMGPSAGKGGSIGPWVHAIPFNRLYSQSVPQFAIKGARDRIIHESWFGDIMVLSSFYNPNVTFIIRRPDVLEFAVDSNHSVFRVIRDDNQELFVVAKYANRLVDSIKISTVKGTFCTPWPECFYTWGVMTDDLSKLYLHKASGDFGVIVVKKHD
jgi:hypothetical protein